MSPLLFPAIDLRDGRCVRLLQGEFDRETDYGDDPVGWARSFEEAGAPWLHVVDLDGARTGVSRNGESIRAVVSAVNLPVQVGGGVRNVGDACALFDAGVDRVVMGTAAVEYPDLVTEVARHGPVAVGLDVRGIHLAVQGWTRDSGLTVEAALERFSDRAVDAFVVTRIERDGSLDGPDLDGLSGVLAATEVDVVASGGVGSLEDLRALAQLGDTGRPLAGVVVGRALYERAFDVVEATAALGGP